MIDDTILRRRLLLFLLTKSIDRKIDCVLFYYCYDAFFLYLYCCLDRVFVPVCELLLLLQFKIVSFSIRSQDLLILYFCGEIVSWEFSVLFFLLDLRDRPIFEIWCSRGSSRFGVLDSISLDFLAGRCSSQSVPSCLFHHRVLEAQSFGSRHSCFQWKISVLEMDIDSFQLMPTWAALSTEPSSFFSLACFCWI